MDSGIGITLVLFAEYIDVGALGRFEGFLAGLWSASFVVVGPEYISMVAAEAKRPRVYIKQAFKTVYWRFGAFCKSIAHSIHLELNTNVKL